MSEKMKCEQCKSPVTPDHIHECPYCYGEFCARCADKHMRSCSHSSKKKTQKREQHNYE